MQMATGECSVYSSPQADSKVKFVLFVFRVGGHLVPAHIQVIRVNS